LILEAGPDAAVDLVDPGTEERGGPEGSLRALELSGALEEALATLAPADQVLLKLRFDDNLSAQQIARMLRFPTPFHVYRRINALLATLRETLRARGIENSVP
jgi:DNA-directed RNA polymerase specialized sigma24 family protein